jgi:hypothetical protein
MPKSAFLYGIFLEMSEDPLPASSGARFRLFIIRTTGMCTSFLSNKSKWPPNLEKLLFSSVYVNNTYFITILANNLAHISEQIPKEYNSAIIRLPSVNYRSYLHIKARIKYKEYSLVLRGHYLHCSDVQPHRSKDATDTYSPE